MDKVISNLVVFSHKICWESNDSPTGWATDGGFAMHMDALAPFFKCVKIVVPVTNKVRAGEVFFTNSNIEIIPLKEWVDPSRAFLVKLVMPFWFLWNIKLIIGQINRSELIHVPVPSHIGIMAVGISLILKKKLYVRHCGNWSVPTTITEKVLRLILENIKSPNLVVLATGGGDVPPSPKNPHIKWIFSSSIWRRELKSSIKSRKLTSDKATNLVHIARQEIEKGAKIVIQSVRYLTDQKINVKLKVVGDGLAMSELRRYTKELNLDEKVIFTGKLNHQGVLDVLDSSDIFCYPTAASEGFPKVVLEAMSRGVPVITTPVSVLKSMIPDSSAGVLIKPDAYDLTAAIISLVENSAEYKNMSLSGPEYVQKFSLENWADHIIEYVQSGLKINIKS